MTGMVPRCLASVSAVATCLCEDESELQDDCLELFYMNAAHQVLTLCKAMSLTVLAHLRAWVPKVDMLIERLECNVRLLRVG